ncbi:MAG: glycosyltransferase family 4 protein [Coraliomargaritaceae bacterium]
MNVCIVTETYPPEVNGVAMSLHRISCSLQKLGHSVHIVRPRQSSEAQHAAYEDETIVPGLPLPGYDGLRFGLPCRRKLRDLWASRPTDIIYVATEGPLGQSAIRAAEDLDIPVTSGFHTNFHEYMRHYKMPLFAKAVEGFLRQTHNRTSRTFAPSQHVIQRLQNMGIEGTRMLGRGVDTTLFNPEQRDPALRQRWGVDPETGVVAIFVSRLAAEKNIPLAARAFEKIQKTYPDVACVFVGDGPEREGLEKKYPQFIFAGMQTEESLASHYASADIFIFPSVTETFGNVVTEALASGLVVLAYNYAAPQEYIRHGENGFLASFDEEADYMQQLKVAMQSKADWPAIRQAARATAKNLSWEAVVRSFASELQTVCEESATTHE